VCGVELLMTDHDAPMITVGERYVLVEELAADDKREVWRGHDDLASRQVVVKLYDGPDAEDPQWRRRFDHRARQLAALSEPGIASVLEHDAEDSPVWIAFANVPGTTLEATISATELDPEHALRIVGQAALALKAAHDVGLTHGDLTARHLMLRPDGSVALIGFDLSTAAGPAHDLADLRILAHELLPRTEANSETGRFLGWLDGGKQPAPTDPGDIGRTALALAVALRGGPVTPVIPAAATSAPEGEPTAEQARRPWYDEDERRRVRNGLIALATIVVIAGAALLILINRGGGPNITTVPSVVGLTLTDAQTQLTEQLLVVNENLTDPQGRVTAESPAAGTRVKVGTTVTLTVTPSAGG
jgi:tRNA A-37 threonylcarbamoyl transferase component Bud32